MEQRRLAAAGGANDAEKLSRLHLQVDMVESKQAFAALGAVTQADVAQADFGNLGRNIAARKHGCGPARFSSRTTYASRYTGIDGNRKPGWKIMCVRAQWIAFLPFSART